MGRILPWGGGTSEEAECVLRKLSTKKMLCPSSLPLHCITWLVMLISLQPNNYSDKVFFHSKAFGCESCGHPRTAGHSCGAD